MLKNRFQELNDLDTENQGNDDPQTGAEQDAEEIAKRDADFSRLDDRLEVDSMRKRVEVAEGEAEEHKDRYLRALADLENTKKRAIKDRADLLKYQGDRIFSELLQVVDNMELALQHAESDPATLKEGVQLIYKLLTDTLGKWEVRSESALGKQFDPSRHSALSQVPTDEEKPGTILNEFRKAYFYKDKLLRPGEVVVASALADSQGEGFEDASDDEES